MSNSCHCEQCSFDKGFRKGHCNGVPCMSCSSSSFGCSCPSSCGCGGGKKVGGGGGGGGSNGSGTSSSNAAYNNYQNAYFQVTAAEAAKDTYDIVIIGSGIGGGVLAADLMDKNKELATSATYFTSLSTPSDSRGMPISSKSKQGAKADSSQDQSLKILVIEKGGLLFDTHCLNGPRPTKLGGNGQMNDGFFNTFKSQFALDSETEKSKQWVGGPVFCLGGRSNVWGLFAPRVNVDTFTEHFPSNVYNDLSKVYLRRAEEIMNLSCPETLPLHQALMDKLNLRPQNSTLPTTQWEWGRIASEFRDPKNYDFAEGAYSTVDRLLENAMNDPKGEDRFKTLLNAQVDKLEPKPSAKASENHVKQVVLKDGTNIKCKNVVLCAGSVESAAILLRSGSTSDYGDKFSKDFGHITDHHIYGVRMPFVYRDMAKMELLGGMKLQTDAVLTSVDNTKALVNMSIDAASFLPRRDTSKTDLPEFILTFILPSPLVRGNSVTLNNKREPVLHMTFADDSELKRKEKVMKQIAVDAMNKIAEVLDVQFVKPAGDKPSKYTVLTEVAESDVSLHSSGLGVVAHELGTIPMPDANYDGGIVDPDLKLQYGWDNVFVCDLSVFPYSPAANPTLTLAALALRLSDKLIRYVAPQFDSLAQPIPVYNFTRKSVWVNMSNTGSASSNSGPDGVVEIKSGESKVWRRTRKQVLVVRNAENSTDWDFQMVYPSVNALIVKSPPA